MNGTDLKKAAINQAKKVATSAAQAASSNGQKKRRKGDNLKPIITTDGQVLASASPPTVTMTPAG
jgi:serine/threonine-protein kinase SRPK3